MLAKASSKRALIDKHEPLFAGRFLRDEPHSP